MNLDWNYEDSQLTIRTRHVEVTCTPYSSYYTELTEFFDPDDIKAMEIYPQHIVFWSKETERPYTVPATNMNIVGDLKAPRYVSDPFELEGYTRFADHATLRFDFDDIEVYGCLSDTPVELPEVTRWLEDLLRKKIDRFYLFRASTQDRWPVQRVILSLENMQKKHADLVDYVITIKDRQDETEDERAEAERVWKKRKEALAKEEENGPKEVR